MSSSGCIYNRLGQVGTGSLNIGRNYGSGRTGRCIYNHASGHYYLWPNRPHKRGTHAYGSCRDGNKRRKRLTQAYQSSNGF